MTSPISSFSPIDPSHQHQHLEGMKGVEKQPQKNKNPKDNQKEQN